MTFKPLRQWLTDLLGPSPRELYVQQLKEQLAKSEHLADYFRTRAERLELRLIPEVQARPVRPVNAQPVGRKSWAQVQAENQERIKKELEEEAQRKVVKGAN